MDASDIYSKRLNAKEVIFHKEKGEFYFPIKHDRTPSFFTNHSQPIVSRKPFGWKLKKSYTKKKNESPRPHPKISFQDNWMKEIGFRSCSTTRRRVARQAKSSQLNPINPPIQIMIERGDPLIAQKERPVLRKSIPRFSRECKNFTLKKHQITIERGDPLCAHNQSAQC